MSVIRFILFDLLKEILKKKRYIKAYFSSFKFLKMIFKFYQENLKKVISIFWLFNLAISLVKFLLYF